MSENFLDVLTGDKILEAEEKVQKAIPVINLHPALPGAFDGANAIDRAYEAFRMPKEEVPQTRYRSSSPFQPFHPIVLTDGVLLKDVLDHGEQVLPYRWSSEAWTGREVGRSITIRVNVRRTELRGLDFKG